VAATDVAGALAWADTLNLIEGWLTPDRRLVVLQDHDGNPVRFEDSRIHPYALRHTFSQLRVNAGVAVHELAALLGHDSLRTTQAYYRITAKMKRAAMERVAPLQLGADGGRLRMAGDPSPSDVLRYAVGQVAVPFGVCVEPSNVAAHGQAYPFRHRCFGCKHFRTDPSYLPELRSHRDRLLADRERLLATIPDLADWARRDALPSDAEVDAVRRLIHRCELGPGRAERGRPACGGASQRGPAGSSSRDEHDLSGGVSWRRHPVPSHRVSSRRPGGRVMSQSRRRPAPSGTAHG
jgi:hypothetical protein